MPRDRNSSESPRSYSFLDAAEKVLEESAEKRPMHYQAITDKAIDLGYLNVRGQTPELSMNAQLNANITRAEEQGQQSRFFKHCRGYFGLSKWKEHGPIDIIEQNNEQVRQALHQRLLEMEPYDFEALIVLLLTNMGFEETEHSRRSRDGGIDVRGTMIVGDAIRIKMAVQVKKWTRNVDTTVVQNVRGSLGTHEKGLIITTSDFSQGAKREAARQDAVPVDLMNGKTLVSLLCKYEIGVSRQPRVILVLEATSVPDVSDDDSAPID